jgi:hypothetical protein
MTQPLVDQLRFTRSEWLRGLRGTTEEDGLRRLQPMNSIGWIVGHLAWQEQRNFLTRAQGTTPIPLLNEIVANGGPATTPALREMRAAWLQITRLTDPWLDEVSAADLVAELAGQGPRRSVGDGIQRVVYHYWFHIGEILAIRQILGNPNLPEFVGDLELHAHYRAG